jgi:hypothetical protein
MNVKYLNFSPTKISDCRENHRVIKIMDIGNFDSQIVERIIIILKDTRKEVVVV